MLDSQEILIGALNRQGLIAREQTMGVNGEKFTYVTAPSGKRLVISWKKYKYPFASSSAYILSLDKSVAYEHVDSLGYATPRSWYLTKDDGISQEVIDLLSSGRGEMVVVKPLDSGLGRGITTDVADDNVLRQAIDTARNYSDTCIIQRQFFGEEYRCIVVDGVARSVILRQKPHVIGDGHSSVEHLVEIENEKRKQIVDSMVTYPQLTEPLLGEVVNDQRVPASGERVELGRGTMISKGASIYDVTHQIHESYKAIASDIGSSIGEGFVVVDMMIQDHTIAAQPDNYIFLEYNMSPALKLFYSCRDGKHVKVAEEYIAPKIVEILR